MYYSKKLSLLFIGSPKSGTRSVEKYLMKIDSAGENHSVTLDHKKITSKDMHFGVVGHARAWELKRAIGEDVYNQLQVLGLVRHPFDKLISSYFFNKKVNLLSALSMKGEKRMLTRKIKGLLSSLAPKILPIGIWALLFPMKTSYDYFFDRKGNRIVKYLGRTDHLNEDLFAILRNIGITSNLNIPHINQSQHKARDQYFKNPWIEKTLAKKYSRDIELYDLAEKEMQEIHKKLNVNN
jgi:hypothetical protein